MLAAIALLATGCGTFTLLAIERLQVGPEEQPPSEIVVVQVIELYDPMPNAPETDMEEMAEHDKGRKIENENP